MRKQSLKSMWILGSAVSLLVGSLAWAKAPQATLDRALQDLAGFYSVKQSVDLNHENWPRATFGIIERSRVESEMEVMDFNLPPVMKVCGITSCWFELSQYAYLDFRLYRDSNGGLWYQEENSGRTRIKPATLNEEGFYVVRPHHDSLVEIKFETSGKILTRKHQPKVCWVSVEGRCSVFFNWGDPVEYLWRLNR